MIKRFIHILLISNVIIIFIACSIKKKNIYQSIDTVDYYFENKQLAIEHYKALSKKFPQNAEHHRMLGICYREHGHLDSSIIEFNQSIQLAPNYGNAYAGRASLYLKRKLLQEAKKDCDLAIHFNSTALGQVYSILAAIALETNDYNSSLNYLKKANHYSDVVYCSQNNWIKAQNYMYLGDTSLAEKYLNRHLETAPKDSTAKKLVQKLAETKH